MFRGLSGKLQPELLGPFPACTNYPLAPISKASRELDHFLAAVSGICESWAEKSKACDAPSVHWNTAGTLLEASWKAVTIVWYPLHWGTTQSLQRSGSLAILRRPNLGEKKSWFLCKCQLCSENAPAIYVIRNKLWWLRNTIFFLSMQSSENVPAYQTQHSCEGSPAMQNDKNSKADGWCEEKKVHASLC